MVRSPVFILSMSLALASAFYLPSAHDAQRIFAVSTEGLDKARYLLEFEGGITRWATEDEKWAYKREGQNFMDITNHQDLGTYHVSSAETVKYPAHPAYKGVVRPMLRKLSQNKMRENLEHFTSFHTRYYKSDTGKQSSAWLLDEVRKLIAKAGADKGGAYVNAFPHSWGQASIIAHIPGQSNNTIVVGAHQDSINLFLPSILAAPGADDDGSGTVTILEALRVLLTSRDIVQGKAKNTVEFHWYSAEEGGLLGSQEIFKKYEQAGRDVKAMLQQDMTGYVEGTLKAGKPESVGVITDYVDPDLTAFIKTIITGYCDIPYVETECGYACSDHASASKAGYPSAFVIESEFGDSDKKIHTTEDKLEYLSFDHMLQHAKMTLAFAYELAFAKFD